jgi:hypothetical protein
MVGVTDLVRGGWEFPRTVNEEMLRGMQKLTEKQLVLHERTRLIEMVVLACLAANGRVEAVSIGLGVGASEYAYKKVAFKAVEQLEQWLWPQIKASVHGNQGNRMKIFLQHFGHSQQF